MATRPGSSEPVKRVQDDGSVGRESERTARTEATHTFDAWAGRCSSGKQGPAGAKIFCHLPEASPGQFCFFSLTSKLPSCPVSKASSIFPFLPFLHLHSISSGLCVSLIQSIVHNVASRAAKSSGHAGEFFFSSILPCCRIFPRAGKAERSFVVRRRPFRNISAIHNRPRWHFPLMLRQSPGLIDDALSLGCVILAPFVAYRRRRKFCFACHVKASFMSIIKLNC